MERCIRYGEHFIVRPVAISLPGLRYALDRRLRPFVSVSIESTLALGLWLVDISAEFRSLLDELERHTSCLAETIEEFQ